MSAGGGELHHTVALGGSSQSIDDMPVDGDEFLELFVELHVTLFGGEATQGLCQLLGLQCFLKLVEVALAFLQDKRRQIRLVS